MVMFPFLAFTQDSPIGNWINYFGNKKINNTWNWHHEIQYRNYNAIGDLEQLLIRTGIGYNLTENNNNVLLGYGYILSDNYIPNTKNKFQVHEHRIYQQFVTKQTAWKLKLQHRYRFEQRFVGDQSIKYRFRYALGLKYPLDFISSEKRAYYLTFYNELFVDAKERAFDRNRVFGGLGCKINKNVRFEVAYMNQIFRVGSRDQINLNTFVNF